MPSVELVRLVSQRHRGDDDGASALARGFTGRASVVKFAGDYHGHGDAAAGRGGSGVATARAARLGRRHRRGRWPTPCVVPYNVVPALDDDVACVIVEPVAANMGLVPPAPGFLEGLRAACDRVGALLVFDEVITGFRLARGGAQELTGVRPTCRASAR